ncbi:MAG: hypothetical protein JSS14_21950 [Proteobacteria bacterium]|nr:hypothetical protein [Pseudomonadota bacterium]
MTTPDGPFYVKGGYVYESVADRLCGRRCDKGALCQTIDHFRKTGRSELFIETYALAYIKSNADYPHVDAHIEAVTAEFFESGSPLYRSGEGPACPLDDSPF